MSAGALYSSCPFTSEEQIRILRLAPATDFDEDLRGELEVRSFTRLPPYEALSYTWQPPFEGQTLPDSVIWFFGYPLPITGNLSNGLRRLRRKDKERVLWVDAVCMDQGNARERNHQAHMMAEIYSRAVRVLAWLGEDSTMRDGTYTLASLAASDADTLALIDIKTSLRHGKAPLDHAFHDQCDEVLLFQTFTSRRFFRRRWVLQELILARSVEVICGSYCLAWNIFAAALIDRCKSTQHDLTLAGPLRTLFDLVHSIWSFQVGSDKTFLETMRQFEETDCGDDRDRICALMHVRKFPELQDFHADYSLSCGRFYCAFAASIRRTSPRHFEEYLRLAALQRAEHEISLPSWVPDWRVRAHDSIPTCLADSPYMSHSDWWVTHDLVLLEDCWSDQRGYDTGANSNLLALLPSYNFNAEHSDVDFHCFQSDEQRYSKELIVGPTFGIMNPLNNVSGPKFHLALVLRDYGLPQRQFRIAGVCSFRRREKPDTEMVYVEIV